MSCQQVPTTPAFNPYPRSVQVGEFEVAIGGGIWVAIRASPMDLLATSNLPRLQEQLDRMGIAARPARNFWKRWLGW